MKPNIIENKTEDIIHHPESHHIEIPHIERKDMMIDIMKENRSRLFRIEIMGHHLIDYLIGIFLKTEKICFIEVSNAAKNK